jgi:cell division protein FtsB
LATKEKQQLSNNNLLIIMILVTLLVIGVTAFAVKFLLADIALHNKVIKAKNDANATLTADVNAAPKVIDDYNKMKSDNQDSLLADALPNDSDFPSLIVTMENIENDAGLTLLKSVSAAPDTTGITTTTGSGTTDSSVVTPPSPQSYPFSVTVSSTYATLLKALKDIELSARPIRVTGLNLNGGGSTLTTELQLTTYSQGKATLPFGTKEVK